MLPKEKWLDNRAGAFDLPFIKKRYEVSKTKTTWLVAGALMFGAGAASAQLGSIFKAGGTIVIVNKFGKQIDSALNKVTGQNKLKGQGIVTKVVPVISAGSRGSVGIVQVAGTREQVNKVKVVVQLQTQVRAVSVLQARVLIPVDSSNLARTSRVPGVGVGVSAIIDIKL